MTDTTTTPRKRGRPRLTLSDAERAERIRVYQRDYGLKRRAKNAEAIRAYARERRAARMREPRGRLGGGARGEPAQPRQATD